MNNPTYLLIITAVGADAFGVPQIIEADRFAELQGEASKHTAGNCQYKVLAKIDNDFHVTLPIADNSGENEYWMEYYTTNPVTREAGWDIKNIVVKASNKTDAVKKLKLSDPLFDCVIQCQNTAFN